MTDRDDFRGGNPPGKGGLGIDQFRKDETLQPRSLRGNVIPGETPLPALSGPSGSPVRAPGPIDGWLIALEAGKTLVGRAMGHLGRVMLDPAYELTVVQVQLPTPVTGPDGRPGISISLQSQRMIGGISNFLSWTSIVLSPNAITQRVEDLNAEEYAMLAKNVADIEGAVAGMAKQAREAALAAEAMKVKPYGGARNE
jgi:hypothetical protein